MTMTTLDKEALRARLQVPTVVRCLVWLMIMLGLSQGILRLSLPTFSTDVAVIGMVLFVAAAVVEAYFSSPPTVPVREPKVLTVASLVLICFGLLGPAFALFGAFDSVFMALAAIPAGVAMLAVGCYSVVWASWLVRYNRTRYPPFAPDS